MTLTTVKALTFDTGGTILDWHTGFSRALKNTGTKYGMDKDWGHLANELRRRSLKIVLNQGKHEIPEHTFDDAHRIALDKYLQNRGFHTRRTRSVEKFGGMQPIISKHGQISHLSCPSFDGASSAPLLQS